MSGSVKYYTDEHISGAVIEGLKRRGIAVLTAKEANLLQAPDDQHLAFAAKHGCVLVTQDSDFIRKHAQGIKHNGIVYARQSLSIGKIIEGLALIHEVLDMSEMENTLQYI